ncbi:FxsA family protein [Streptosporangium sp. NPDC049304]|uniref:FxsA family protein n=1 Tax=Streptosporangium sp. NPDC049304 TaxID=3154830 RepID=UPI003443752C
MRILLFLTFLVVPFLEIWVLIQVGQLIGGWPTVALLLAGSLLGAWVVRREGRRAWRSLQEALQSGRAPERELAGGGLTLVGGMLLIAPGFLSDVLGLLCLLPFTRPMVRGLGSWLLARRIRTLVARNAGGAGLGSPFGAGSPFDVLRDGGRPPGSGPVVHGEVIREEPGDAGGPGGTKDSDRGIIGR